MLHEGILNLIENGGSIKMIISPQLSDLRESGSIEQDADIVMFLYRDKYYNPETYDKNIAELIIAKNRNGIIDSVKLFFAPEIMKFVSYAETEEEI